jgi:hypothetical protein
MRESGTYHAVVIRGPADTGERLALIPETDGPAVFGSRARARAFAMQLRIDLDPRSRIRVVDIATAMEWEEGR